MVMFTFAKFVFLLVEGNYNYGSGSYEKPWQDRKPPYPTRDQIWNCPRASLTSKACSRTDFEKRSNKASVAWNSNKREQFCQLYTAACVDQGLSKAYNDCMRQTGDMYLNVDMESEETKLQSDSFDCRHFYLRSEAVGRPYIVLCMHA